MEFINFQAEVDDGNGDLERDFAENNEDGKFTDDSQQEPSTSLSFDRRFHNQSREIRDALNGRSDDNCKLDTLDLQPEMYWEIDRSFVEFEKFDGYEKTVEKFKKSLCTSGISDDPKDSFHNAILFDLVFKLSKNSVINKDTIIQALGKKFLGNFQKEKEILQLDVSFCNFEKICCCK